MGNVAIGKEIQSHGCIRKPRGGLGLEAHKLGGSEVQNIKEKGDLTPGASFDLRIVCSSLSRIDNVQSLGGSS